MKHRNNFKYILSVAYFLCLMLGMGSCIREELFDETKDIDYSSVAIKVKMPEQTIVKPMTRAEASQFDELTDMNILISVKGDILRRFYLDFDPESTVELPVGVTLNREVEGEYRLDFTPEYLEGIDLKGCQFHAVANFGRLITETDAADVFALRFNKCFATESTDLGLETPNYIVPTPNVMYGEIVSESMEVIDPASPGDMRRVVNIELERTAAMITLAIDGSALNGDVVIFLDNVVLRNVPRSCQIGPGNRVGVHADIASYGDMVGGMVLAEGYGLIGTARQNTDGFGEGSTYRTRIGGHYPMADNGEVTDFSNDEVHPLFMFENMQGQGAATTDQTQKRPQNAGTTEDQIKDYNNNRGVESYIEVNANYIRYNGANSIDVAEMGPVTWRFYLGRDITNNFDVERNTNYQITLTLRNGGIGEANTSWRVDTDLESTSIDVDDNLEMVVGGGGEMYCAEFSAAVAGANKVGISGDDNSDQFVWVYAGKHTASWVHPNEITNGAMEDGALGDQTWFYVAPLLPGESVDWVGETERTAIVNFHPQNSNQPEFASAKFTQYRPLKAEVTWEDVQDQSDEDMQEIKAMIERFYNYTFEEGADPFVIYVDRIDRNAMPWGFEGVTLDKNQNTGFENVYHLIDPLPENVEDENVCNQHIEYAKNYLPTGRGWKVNNTKVDYSRGSCMMHAAMENHFQQWGTGAPRQTPQQLMAMGLPERPGENNGDNTYGWCVPSIVGWQLLEKLDRHEKEHGNGIGIFDPKYPIIKWVSYWTSNAGTSDISDKYPKADGKTNAFVYQFGMGLDKMTENDNYPGYLLMPRTTPLRYRLINIDPKYIKSSNGQTR